MDQVQYLEAAQTGVVRDQMHLLRRMLLQDIRLALLDFLHEFGIDHRICLFIDRGKAVADDAAVETHCLVA
jgi:hypothetical protein